MILLPVAKTVAVIVRAFFVYLLFVALAPGMSVPEQPLENTNQATQEWDTQRAGLRKDVNFEVKGTSLSAWLYLPENLPAPVPCIIMASGAGGTKDAGMEPYAYRFQEAGFAVLLFDYRFFGESGGEPRQLLSVPYQLEDYAGAIQYARGLNSTAQGKLKELSGGER